MYLEINKAGARKPKPALVQNMQNTKVKLKNNCEIIMKQLIKNAKSTYVAKPYIL